MGLTEIRPLATPSPLPFPQKYGDVFYNILP